MILLAAGAFMAPNRFTTANAAAPEVELSDIQAQINELKAENERLRQQTGVAQAPADPLGLGGMQLPKGVTEKDVLWRKQAGLNLKQAVAAALAQVRHIAKRATEAAQSKPKGAKAS